MEKVKEVKDEVAVAQELLQAKENEKLASFQQEYKVLTEKYGYELSPMITLTRGNVDANLQVIKT